MERGVEHRHHRHVFHDFAAALYAGNVARHVQRSEFRVLFADFYDLIGNDNRRMEVFARMENTVTDRGNFIHGFDYAAVFADESVQHHFDGRRMVRHVLFENVFLTVGFMFENRAFNADSLAETFGNDAFVLHVDKLIFERRTARVYYKNFHCLFPLNQLLPAWHAVRATTPTISSTTQPLDKSLIGFAIPWQIGPNAFALANL